MTQGVWLKIAKKDSGVASVTYAEALDVALCHGWIDGLKRSLRRTVLPAALHAAPPEEPVVEDQHRQGRDADRRRPHGSRRVREVEAAKADGRWQAAYDSASRMQVPDELAAALKKNRKAAAFFDQLDRTNRYAFCWRVQTAKKPETRAARVAKLVAMLARGREDRTPEVHACGIASQSENDQGCGGFRMRLVGIADTARQSPA